MTNITNNTGSNEPELTPQVRARIKELIDSDPEMTQQVIANQVGINKSRLSLWLNDNYTGDVEKVTRALKDWLDKREESARVEDQLTVPEDPPFYETPTVTDHIWPVFQYAQLRGGMGLIYGGAGVCKSTGAREYQKRMPNVTIVTCSPATARLSSFLSLTLNEMGITSISKKAAVIEQEIVDRLKGSRGLLLIDEGQYLPVETLYEITMLRERSRVAVVIMGNEAIYGQMRKGFAQLHSRVGKRKKLSRPLEGDLNACLRAWERHQKLSEGHLDHKVHDFFWGDRDKKLGPVRQDGGLRNVSECLALSFFLAAGDNRSISLKHIQAAWKDIAA